MLKHNITSVISFCSNDFRFIHRLIENARIFSRQIIVSVCDHFFNGEKENYEILEQLFGQYPDCLFIEFKYNLEDPYAKHSPLLPEDPDGNHHWHNCSRLIPYYFIEKETDFILFFDADEIPQGELFLQWLDHFNYQSFAAIRFASYWYFREAKYRANTFADTVLMVKKELLDPSWIINPDERMGLFHLMQGEKKQQVFGLEGLPMFHHYSWVRTKNEMLKKTRCWGHHWERNWRSLIDEEFSREFKGVDFIRRYEYTTVTPFFDPLSAAREINACRLSLDEHISNINRFSHVKLVSAKELFRLDLLKQLE